MKKIHCELHNIDIIIYNKEEESLFKDDNRNEVAIFYDNEGKKYLKRVIVNQCDESCETVKELLK